MQAGAVLLCLVVQVGVSLPALLLPGLSGPAQLATTQEGCLYPVPVLHWPGAGRAPGAAGGAGGQLHAVPGRVRAGKVCRRQLRLSGCLAPLARTGHRAAAVQGGGYWLLLH